MSVLALHHHPDAWEVRRYALAATAIVLLFAAMIAAAFTWYQRPEPAGVSLQPIFVDLAPAPVAQQVSTEDVAPGPEMQQADAPPPEPPKPQEIEQLPPTPPQPEPVVAAPPKVEPKVEPSPVKPQPVQEKKKPAKKPPAPRTSAPQKADRVAPDAPSATSGASAAAAAASYRSILVAHLQRFKQYPDNANGASGRPTVAVTITRGGRVTGSRLVKSSGVAVLDQAALALVQRAQPMPPFPPEMREASQTFTAPFSYVQPR